MKKLLTLLVRKHPLRFALAIVLGMIAGGFTAALIAAIHRGATQPHDPTAKLLFAVAALANVVAATVAYSNLLSLANEILAELRVSLARSILGASYGALEKMGSSVLLAALTDDTQAIGGAANAIVTTLIAGAACAGAFAYIATLSPLVCLAILLPVLIGARVYRALAKRGQMVVGKAMAIRMRLMRSVSSSVSGAKELKLHAPRSAAFFSEALAPATREMHGTLHASYRMFTWAESIQLVLFFLVTGLVFFAWPRFVPGAEDKLPAVALAVLFLPASVSALFMFVPVIIEGGEAVDRLEKLGLTLSGAAQDSDASPTPRPWSKLELRGLSYKYRGDG
ncbi:MAG: hypothetical protein ACREJX_07830, partial [Polyangiaceae bacterium]